jgi:hypothetical protein
MVATNPTLALGTMDYKSMHENENMGMIMAREETLGHGLREFTRHVYMYTRA